MSGSARTLEPEVLDVLAANDPRACRSRRDLVRINFVMRQQAIMAALLHSAGTPPCRIAGPAS